MIFIQQRHLISNALKIGIFLCGLSCSGISTLSYAQTKLLNEIDISKESIFKNSRALQPQRFKTLYRLAHLHIQKYHPQLTIKTKFGVTITIDKYGNTIKGYPAYQVSDKDGKIFTIMLEFLKVKKGWQFLKRIEN